MAASIVLGIVVALLGVLWFLQTRDVTVLTLVLYGVWFGVAGWTYRDATRRRQPGIPWALVVLVGHVLGLAVYLTVRSVSSPPSQGIERP